MARGNVQRNPKRTARTAAPVLIGVALVTGASVFAASIKVQLRETIGSTFVGDYVINTSNGGALSFSQTFIDELNTLPEVGEATGLGFVPLADANGERAGGATINPQTAAGLLQFDFLQGSLASLTPDGMLISDGEAKRKHLSLGGDFDVRIDGHVRPLVVQGIYATADFIPARTYHRDTFAGTSLSNTAGFVSLTRATGVGDHEFRAAVDAQRRGIRHRRAAGSQPVHRQPRRPRRPEPGVRLRLAGVVDRDRRVRHRPHTASGRVRAPSRNRIAARRRNDPRPGAHHGAMGERADVGVRRRRRGDHGSGSRVRSDRRACAIRA